MSLKEELLQLIRSVSREQQSQILEAAELTPFSVQKITLDLSVARTEDSPYVINFPFKSMVVKNATGSIGSINIKLNKNDTGISSFTMDNNDVFNSSRMVRAAYIWNTAQPGKTIDIIIFKDASFTSGSLINSGTVAISNPSTGTLGQTTLVGATAAIIAPVSLLRRSCTIQNVSGTDLFIGDSTVTNTGATQGIKIIDGQTFTWTNTAALYGYSVAGGKVVRIEEI